MKNILLVQFRRDASALHERDCFLRYFQKRKTSKLKVINAFDKKTDFFNPPKFFAQFGHRDSLKVLPKGTKLLAKTKKCKVAAFKYKDRIWGVQFHPELNYRDMLFRLKLYPQYSTQNLERMKENLKPTPFSSRVIKNFLDKICLL